jgi:hypothetical protein
MIKILKVDDSFGKDFFDAVPSFFFLEYLWLFSSFDLTSTSFPQRQFNCCNQTIKMNLHPINPQQQIHFPHKNQSVNYEFSHQIELFFPIPKASPRFFRSFVFARILSIMCCNVQWKRRKLINMFIKTGSSMKKRKNKCLLRALWSKLGIYLCLCTVKAYEIHFFQSSSSEMMLYASGKLLALNFPFSMSRKLTWRWASFLSSPHLAQHGMNQPCLYHNSVCHC